MIERYRECEACLGDGTSAWERIMNNKYDVPCPDCNGTGKVDKIIDDYGDIYVNGKYVGTSDESE